MNVIKFAPGLIPVLKHEEHDQKTHGSWAGVSGLATLGKELLTPAQIKAFDNEIKKVPESHIEALRASGTKVRIMDSPKVMSPDEAPHFNRGDNEIRLDKNSGASALLHEIGHALDFNAKSGNGFLSDDPNFRKIIKDSKFPDFSTQRNTFARNEEFAVAYENYYTDGGRFIGASPTKEFKQVMEGIGTYILSEKVQKHQEHDQSSHGNWATLTNTTFGDYKMTFEYQPSNELSLHFIHAYDQNKKQVGQLRWDSYTGTVNSISVEPEHQRKGIATAMWNWATQLSKTPAKDFPENIKHGWGIEKPRHDRFIVTPQGKSWVESLQKHEGGGHDQSSHGNWAGETSNTISESEVYSKYLGLKLEDMEEYKLAKYTENGVRLNNELRANKTDPALIEKAFKEMDSAIEKAPKFPNKEVYRVAPSFLAKGMEVGTVIQDLGYQSTTIADLSKPENKGLLRLLGGISSGEKSLIRINLGSKGTGIYLPAVTRDSVAAQEKEFLLPRNTKLRYTGNEKFELTTIHKFEVVNDN
jgi:GNAT superfamily N-acetyltransferase